MERHYDDGTEPTVLPHYSRHCTGPCNQGRLACPCPLACEFEDKAGPRAVNLLSLAFLAVVLVAVVVLLLFKFLPR